MTTSQTAWWDWKVVRVIEPNIDPFGNALVEVRYRRWHPGYWINRFLWRIGWHRIIEG
jgi:hypothetical protein